MQEAFGDYKVLERVGAGTKSEVFRARDTRAGRTAAIKVLTSDLAMDPVVGAPFVDDAYLAQKLGHPSAAALYDIGEQDGRPHLVYEFIQGQTLKSLLAGHPINPRRALELTTQVADALAEAHALGLVHRALRPEKVMVSQKGSAKVLDFGLGHYATAVHRQLYAAGGPAGATALRAMAYWAPEQHITTADARSDIYSLGLMLLEMLTGREPSGTGAAPDVAGVPASIQPLLGRLLAVDPAMRLDSAATVAAESRQLVTQLEVQREAPVVTAGAAVSAAPAAVAAPSTGSISSPAGSPQPVPARSKAVTAAPPAQGRKGAGVAAKKASGVTVTTPAPAPAAPAPVAPSSSAPPAATKGGTVGRKGTGKGRPPATSRPPSPAQSAAAPPRPVLPPSQPVDVSGLGKAAAVIAIAVLVLMAILYFVM